MGVVPPQTFGVPYYPSLSIHKLFYSHADPVSYLAAIQSRAILSCRNICAWATSITCTSYPPQRYEQALRGKHRCTLKCDGAIYGTISDHHLHVFNLSTRCVSESRVGSSRLGFVLSLLVSSDQCHHRHHYHLISGKAPETSAGERYCK